MRQSGSAGFWDSAQQCALVALQPHGLTTVSAKVARSAGGLRQRDKIYRAAEATAVAEAAIQKHLKQQQHPQQQRYKKASATTAVAAVGVASVAAAAVHKSICVISNSSTSSNTRASGAAIHEQQ